MEQSAPFSILEAPFLEQVLHVLILVILVRAFISLLLSDLFLKNNDFLSHPSLLVQFSYTFLSTWLEFSTFCFVFFSCAGEGRRLVPPITLPVFPARKRQYFSLPSSHFGHFPILSIVQVPESKSRLRKILPRY